MKINELIDYGNKQIHKDKVKLLLSQILGYNPLELYNHLDENVDIDKEETFKKVVEAVVNNTPIQYALGKTNFYGYEFVVNEKVLIPRFETEELVENTIKYIDKYFNGKANIIDLGCGSGAIGISIKKERKECNITLLDISIDALEVAKENSELLSTDVNIIQGDMLDSIEEKFDIIISNPPYIKEDEKIDSLVKDNEPHLALYAKDNGLYFYEKILAHASNNLKDKYIIAFEIGADQANDIIDIAHKHLSDIKIIVKKDMQGRDRMLFVFKNCE